MINVKAPGKLILSGEHAVLYGAPALAMAVNRYVTVTVTNSLLPRVTFDLDDLSYRKAVSIETLKRFKNKIKRNYERFIQGDYHITDVLQKPFELAQFAFGFFQEALTITDFPAVSIHVKSDIPMGCGMGSSAATIMCIVTALARFANVAITNERVMQIALDIENMQHGKSSGLDLMVSQQGGFLRYQAGIAEGRASPTIPMALVSTGMPQCGTGECVVGAAPYFSDRALVDEFTEVTSALDVALQHRDYARCQEAVMANHRLLNAIQVVPAKVNQFIAEIEQAHGAAKICGAGAVRGDSAGAVLILLHDDAALKSICDRFNYTYSVISAESRGVHVV